MKPKGRVTFAGLVRPKDMTGDERSRFSMAGAVVVVGALGLPLLVLGLLTHSAQLCIAGAGIAGAVAVAHVVLILAGK